MKLEIKCLSFKSTPSISDMVKRRAYFSLGRFENRVKRVVVRLKDENGPKKGIDKICQVHVQLHSSHDLVIQEQSDDLYAAIDRAFDRVGRAASREVRKNKSVKNLSDYGGNWLIRNSLA